MRTIQILLLTFLCSAATAWSRDVWVIGMRADGAPINYCEWLHWNSEVMFLNETATPQFVRLLHTSNHAPRAVGEALEIPPGRVVSLAQTRGNYWAPLSDDPLWMSKLEIPDGVHAVSIMRLGDLNCATDGNQDSRGQLTLPTFDGLVPAGKKQTFLGTDVGAIDRRVNVGIYNGGGDVARVTILVSRNCDGSPVASTEVYVPPDTTVQVVRAHSGPPAACGFIGPRGTSVSVTVDQPSIAFVSAVVNDEVTRFSHNFVDR